jgi:tetrahydromethanopterin S-methyltransferase subunit B
MNADDLNFAYKVRHALNEHLDQLPPSTADRLASARKLAVSRKKAHAPVRVAQSQLAGNVGAFFHSFVAGRMGVIIPLLALVVGLAGIYEHEEQQRIAELAELDAAVLSDELPLTAYLDQGFNAYLAQRGQ